MELVKSEIEEVLRVVETLEVTLAKATIRYDELVNLCSNLWSFPERRNSYCKKYKT